MGEAKAKGTQGERMEQSRARELDGLLSRLQSVIDSDISTEVQKAEATELIGKLETENG